MSQSSLAEFANYDQDDVGTTYWMRWAGCSPTCWHSVVADACENSIGHSQAALATIRAVGLTFRCIGAWWLSFVRCRITVP